MGVSPTSKIGLMLAPALVADDPELAPPLDQVFGLLQREYSAERVAREVNALLKLRRNIDTSNHSAILNLSSDALGNPFVITTNFDLMFERANRSLRRWIPPLLPAMTVDNSPTGIVYLHGRLHGGRDDAENLVLGSGDFGRAYLADGWATTFVRQLLERRVVVLLGYSANDPPIRYLLEGLSASTSARLQPIYAFDRGDASVVRAKWKELGITGIGFDRFDDLWSSLKAWALRTSDKSAWNASVLSLASQSPRELSPYERGQVAAIVRTADGAKAFANANPPPQAEWLCVFDELIRYSPPAKVGWASDAREVDPYALYRLDDDPAEMSINERRSRAVPIDLLGVVPEDGASSTHVRLAGASSTATRLDAVRLWHIIRWLMRVVEQPAAIWWAVRQDRLHPELLSSLNRLLNGRSPELPALSGGARQVWANIVEAFDAVPDDGHGWYNLAERIRIEGWSASVLRKLDKVAQPRLSIGRALAMTPLPPAIGDADALARIARFEVVTASRQGLKLDVPDNVVLPVVQAMRRALDRAAAMFSDSAERISFIRLPAIEPERKPGERLDHYDGLDADFLWMVRLFGRLCEKSPSDARREASIWPVSDGGVFDKLRLHFWRNSVVFRGVDVGEGVLSLGDDTFWNPYVQRELLHLLKDRWIDLPKNFKAGIENRIIEGWAPDETVDESEFEIQKIDHTGRALGWLQKNGCALSPSAERTLDAIRDRADWKEDYERSADHDFEGRSGWVREHSDPDALLMLPLHAIVPAALGEDNWGAGDFVRNVPFVGLVRAKPARALRALSWHAKQGSYPEVIWRQLISNFPEEGSSSRLLWICAQRIADLPDAAFFSLRFEATSWLRTHAYRFASQRANEFWCVWDRFFEKLSSIGDEAASSSLQHQSEGDVVRKRAVDDALNSPFGHLLEAKFATLGDRKFSRNEGFSADFSRRLEWLLAAPGDGCSHVAALLGRRLNFVYFVDRNWTKTYLIPQFSRTSKLSEFVWAGLIAAKLTPQPGSLFRLLKDDLLSLFHSDGWARADTEVMRNATQVLVQATFWTRHSKHYLSFDECRRALQVCGDSGRHSALWLVGKFVEEEGVWKNFGRKFFAYAWPQEIIVQTSSTSEQMIRVAQQAPDIFASVVDAVLDYLTPIDHPDMVIYGFSEGRKGGLSLAQQWPTHVLCVLDKIISADPAHAPFGLGGLLEEIAISAPSLRTTRGWRRLHDLLLR